MSTLTKTPEAGTGNKQSRSQPPLRLFTVAEYYKMAEAGILRPEERVELIEGSILTMSPKGIAHAACNDKAGYYLAAILADRVIVRNQNPVHLGEHSEPQPDLVLAIPDKKRYFDHHPTPAEVLLVLEIASSSLDYDLRAKRLLYARVGIIQYCVLDLQARELVDYRDPATEDYSSKKTYRSGESFTLVAFPDISIPVRDLLPPE